MSKAEFDLHLLCGLLTFCASYQRHPIEFGPSQFEPKATVSMGPIRTLHDSEGKLASNNIWFDPTYTEDIKVFDSSSQGTEVFHKNWKWVSEHIGDHPFQKELFELFVLYSKALHSQSMNEAFTQMWTVLEKLTAFDRKYEDVIKRATWGQKDAAIEGEILKMLHQCRNEVTHEIHEPSGTNHFVYFVKKFVDRLLYFAVANVFGAENFAEFHSIIKLSPDTTQLKKAKNSIDLALAYLKKNDVADDAAE